MGSNTETAWAALRDEAKRCTRCPLYKNATQTVFGAGPVSASIMLVGEQPGDQDDLAGLPFVSPAARLLHRAPDAAGLHPPPVSENANATWRERAGQCGYNS